MRIFSGIQPTGRKHLGNYIGAILQYVEGQERTHAAGDLAIYCIVDLHATTVPYEPAVLRERLYDTAAILLASGLDPERCVFFRQGDVLEHSELCWLLSSVTAHGDLNRMHQFKEKSAAQRELVSAGLFVYPVLQAADVLAYRATEVPVGEDQRQHIELMRDIADRFNARFGAGREILLVPDHRIPADRREDHGPPGSGEEDVDDGRLGGGHGLRARRPGHDREEAQARRDRLGERDPARAGQARASRTSSTSSRSAAASRPTRSSPRWPARAGTATSRRRSPRA